MVKSPAVPICIVQGVRHVAPSELRASAPPGLDSTNNPVVVGFGVSESKPGTLTEPQAARPKQQMKRATACSAALVIAPSRHDEFRASACRII